MQVSLDLHDFSIGRTAFFWVNKLKEQYPDLKISMFFIPADIQGGKFRPDEEVVIKKEIEKAVGDGWMELIPHGITHMDREFEKASYEDMETALKAYEEFFGDWGMPYVKGFCAPQWLISQEAIDCLNDHNFWLAIDKNQPDCLKAKKNYEYNWDIARPFPKDLEVVKGHGHVGDPSLNAVKYCFQNLTKIPSDAKFVFVSETV